MTEETVRDFAAGEIILKEGDAADCAYLVVDGLVEVFVADPDGGRVSLGHFGPAAIIGEMALIDGKPRSASVRAVQATRAIVITPHILDRVLGDANPVVRAIVHAYTRRLRTVTQRVDGIALTPKDRPDSVLVLSPEHGMLHQMISAVNLMAAQPVAHTDLPSAMAAIKVGLKPDLAVIHHKLAEPRPELALRQLHAAVGPHLPVLLVGPKTTAAAAPIAVPDGFTAAVGAPATIHEFSCAMLDAFKAKPQNRK